MDSFKIGIDATLILQLYDMTSASMDISHLRILAQHISSVEGLTNRMASFVNLKWRHVT